MKKILKLMHRQFCIFILFKLALEQMSENVSLMLQSWNKIYLHGIKIELKLRIRLSYSSEAEVYIYWPK